jgi:hypothetical protein
MKSLVTLITTSVLWSMVAISCTVAGLSGCSSGASVTGSEPQSELAQQIDQVQKLKSAEYQDDLNAMRFENSNQKLGNYYEKKGSQAHHLIDEMEQGHQVSNETIDKVLDNSDAQKYDARPPVPLDDETGNGY